MHACRSTLEDPTNFFQNVTVPVLGGGERGLLGVAFDPNYASNRFVYVYYTVNTTDAHNRVSRFTANATGDLALASSEFIISELDAHSASNHNGGAMHFGTDGMLYIATGDNAAGANAQLLTNRHGKMLRLDLSGDDFADAGQNWKVPTGQPTTFAGIQGSTSGVNQAIWAIGLRNPFTFAFQPGTGRMFINDVGQGTWEEINEGGSGRNFGWSTTEGDFNQTQFPNFTRPFYTYDHGGTEPNGLAITGGAFYNPTTASFPAEYVGDYFFADYGSSDIWRIDSSTKALTKFASSAAAPVDLKVDNAGNLFYLARGSNQVFRVAFNSQAPSISDQPDNTTVTTGGAATFSVVASGSGTLTYQWQRAESGTTAFGNISGATAASYTLNNSQSGDNGDRFRVIVTDGLARSTTSSFATLTVNANQSPAAGISVTGGLRNGKWDAGTLVSFAGSATDPEQGTLPASAYSWRVDYLSSINGGDADSDGLPGLTRPFKPVFGNTTGSTFTPDTTGPYTLTDVAYVITLTVTDAQGRTDTEQLVLNPNTVNLTVATNPAGLTATVDGQPSAAPITFGSVVGFQRPIGTSSGQNFGGNVYNFVNWSHGGAITQTITTPTINTTYTANFQAQAGGFVAKVNFQTADSQGYAGYVADIGSTFGNRGNGFSYGWNVANTVNARNRNLAASPDERYDTLTHLQKSGGGSLWEIAVPNGTYTVRIVSGDPLYTDAINHLQVETVNLRDPDGADNFDEYNTSVTVTDGRLSVRPGTGASNAKIAFIEITGGPADTTAPTITARTPANGATVTSSSTNIDVTFSEPVTGVDATDLVLTGAGAASAVKAAPVNVSGNTWRFAVSGLTNGAVNVSLAPDANDIQDPTGNDMANALWSFTVAIPPVSTAIRVNFQTTGSQGYPNYLVDSGAVFGNRGNGYSYGWNASNTANTRNRNLSNSPDERYDTFNHLQKGGNFTWEIAVPNGTYSVRIVAGDAQYFDSVFRINAEGTLAVNGTPTSANRWVEGTVTVQVTDGRLTISNGSGAVNNKIGFIEILSA